MAGRKARQGVTPLLGVTEKRSLEDHRVRDQFEITRTPTNRAGRWMGRTESLACLHSGARRAPAHFCSGRGRLPISGERRWRTATLAGLEGLPARVWSAPRRRRCRRCSPDRERQRRGLSPGEIASALRP